MCLGFGGLSLALLPMLTLPVISFCVFLGAAMSQRWMLALWAACFGVILPPVLSAAALVTEGAFILVPLALVAWVRYFMVAPPIPVVISEDTKAKLSRLRR